MATQYFTGGWGIEFPMKNHLIKPVKARIARAGALKAEAPWIRRRTSRVVLNPRCHLEKEWGHGGRVVRLTLGVTCLFLRRASELYAYSNGKIHKEFGLTRGDVCSFLGMTLPASWKYRDRVEVRCIGSKGDRKRLRAVISRKTSVVCPAKIDRKWKEISDGTQRITPPLDGCGDVEVMLELMSIHQQRGPREILATYGMKDRQKVWTREQVTKALRDWVGRQGLVPGEYALHSERSGGGQLDWQRRVYRRGQSNEKRDRNMLLWCIQGQTVEMRRVSQASTHNAKAGSIQPG